MAAALLGVVAPPSAAHAQMPAMRTGVGTSDLPAGPISHDKASTIFPANVFFAGRAAPVQERNTGGAKLANGVLLAGLVDTSGYSSGIQEQYQAYLLIDTPVRFGTTLVQPGAYGSGIVGSEFLLLDLSGKVIARVPATRDTVIARPLPLQVLADSAADTFRLYFGRSYVSFTPGAAGAAK